MTSHDVVSVVRRLTGQRRVGHAGTLDPLAEGVLLLCVGRATKVVEYLVEDRKCYRAEITLGASTDTYDAEGVVTARAPSVDVSFDSVEHAVAGFRGTIEQIPPRYSAIKHQGKPFYKLARAGSDLAPAPRQVTIFRLDIVDWRPPLLGLDIECSKGTYIRSLANDLGAALGCGAFLSRLLRTRSGYFDLHTASTIEELRDSFAEGRAEELIFAFDHALLRIDAVIVSAERARAVGNGRPWAVAEPTGTRAIGTKGPVRVYSVQGEIVAMATYDSATACWQPSKVF